MLVIDKEYFDGGELNIPGTNRDEIIEQVEYFIGKYEPDYLLKALGYPLFKLFKAALPTPGADTRFYKLLNGGVEFEDRFGDTQLWNGIKAVDNCPVSAYVWYWYQTQNASFTGPSGEVKGQTENATAIPILTKQCRAWEEMVKITREMWEYLQYAKDDSGELLFPEFDIKLIDCQLFQVLNVFNL